MGVQLISVLPVTFRQTCWKITRIYMNVDVGDLYESG